MPDLLEWDLGHFWGAYKLWEIGQKEGGNSEQNKHLCL